MKSDTMTAGMSADPSPDLVLQALLAHDLMAFTEFAFGVVRPGILFKPNWHLEVVTYKLSQVAERSRPASDHYRAPAQPQVSMRIRGVACMVPRTLPLGTGGRGLVFRYSRPQPRERLPPRG